MGHRWCNMSSSNKKISQFIESSRHRCSAARQSNSDGISPLPYKIMKTKRPCKMSCQVDDFDSIQCESIAQKNMKRNMTMKKTPNHFSLAHCCCFKRWNKLLHLVYFLLPTAATRRAIDNCFFSFFTPHSKLSHDFFFVFFVIIVVFSAIIRVARLADNASEEPSWTRETFLKILLKSATATTLVNENGKD